MAFEKVNLKKPKAVILDIEGTITSIDFVKSTLFGYVRENLEQYLNANWGKDELQSDIALINEESSLLRDNGHPNIPQLYTDNKDVNAFKTTLIENIRYQMENDMKTKGLKQLQGHMWREGYDSGKLKGHVYGDVFEMLSKWKKEENIKFYIYSSGSVEAQKLLLSSTPYGNLLTFITGHFDTSVGSKLEASSYKRILAVINESPEDVIFFTDVGKEAQAAADAGLNTVVVVREGNAPLTAEVKAQFQLIKSFHEVNFMNS